MDDAQHLGPDALEHFADLVQVEHLAPGSFQHGDLGPGAPGHFDHALAEEAVRSTTTGRPRSSRLTWHVSMPPMPVALMEKVSRLLVWNAWRSMSWVSFMISRK